MDTITIVKQDYRGKETWRYEGKLISRSPNKIVIEAFFDREDTPVEGIILLRGDRFIETYYSDRWYNIYEIQEQLNGRLKLWYCNVAYPAEIKNYSISYRDLALDLLVYPDGRQTVLDEDEFEALPLPDVVKTTARKALLELKIRFSV